MLPSEYGGCIPNGMAREDAFHALLTTRRAVMAALVGRDIRHALIVASAVTEWLSGEAEARRLSKEEVEDLRAMGVDLHRDITQTKGGGAEAAPPVQNNKTGEYTCDVCARPIVGRVHNLGKKDACRNCARSQNAAASSNPASRDDRSPLVEGQQVLFRQRVGGGSRGAKHVNVPATVVRLTREGARLRLGDGSEVRAASENIFADPSMVRVEKGGGARQAAEQRGRA